MKTMQKMRRSNAKVRSYLEKNGYFFIYFVPHSRWQKDLVIDGAKMDGFAINKDGITMFFQVKSNKKPKMQVYRDLYEKYHIVSKVFVVKDRKGVFEYV
jgi:hypothetical protein